MNRMRPLLATLCLLLAAACATHGRQVDYLITEPVIIVPKTLPAKPSPPEERDFDELFRLANEHFDDGDYDRAEQYYRDILTYNPVYLFTPFCYYNLGLIALKKKDFDTAQRNFKAAYLTTGRTEDKLDALNLYLHALGRLGRWEELLDVADSALKSDLTGDRIPAEPLREILLRRAEATAMTGKPAEARTTAQYVIYEIRRERSPDDLLFIPELAMAYFVMGRSAVAEFGSFPFDNNGDVLLRKCTLIQEAQRWFLKTIQNGIIYWTNASAYELAALYRALFDEMAQYPVPAELTEEERPVYECELWGKTAGLLKKARRTLTGSIESARRIHERNEFIDGSLKLLVEINASYETKENFCRSRGLIDEKTSP